MSIPVMTHATGIGQRRKAAAVAAALLTAGAIFGSALSALFAINAVGDAAAVAAIRGVDLPLGELKLGLVGSYAVTGTDPDGTPYAGGRTLNIGLAPSGALELEWDNGRQVGVAQIVGNVLVAAGLSKGRSAILVMHINVDGSLTGRWSRRADRGYRGTETWKKT